MYDAVSDALPLAQQGQNRKKAVLIISDGNDTNSSAGVREVKAQIRESEVMVYAIGIDGQGDATSTRSQPPPRMPMPLPFPFPGRGGRPGTSGGWPRRPPTGGGGGTGWPRASANDDRVNVSALRDMTDDSGGRTEIIRDARDLNPATANIADELSKQYYLGYPSSGKKDGRWHSIRVELKNRSYRVRARRGLRCELATAIRNPIRNPQSVIRNRMSRACARDPRSASAFSAAAAVCSWRRRS
jgi:VWFA-related protein